MKFYQVTDKDLANEVKDKFSDLNQKKDTFLKVSLAYGFSGTFIDRVTMLDDLGEIYCRGFANENKELTGEKKTKFKLTSKGKIAVPRKAYEKEVKEALDGLEFNRIYGMTATWNKFVLKQSYVSSVCGRLVHEGVHGITIDGDNVYLAIIAEREQANLNVNALKEIKESDYLAIQGK